MRRAFLCGFDPVSGKNFDHRKDWLQRRLEALAAAFAIEVLDFALLDNHIHLILRNRPDVVRTWSDLEVVRRWWQICPTRRDEHGEPADPFPEELQQWLDHAGTIIELRTRLSSISWFMRLLCQKLARLANQEDGVSGKFWDSRFKSQALLDEQALLACSMYVDLNMIRAGKAETPEESRYTSVYERILELKRQRQAMAVPAPEAANATDGETAGAASEGDLWLSPIELADRLETRASDSAGPNRELPSGSASECNPFPSRRLTNKGFLPMTLEHYLIGQAASSGRTSEPRFRRIWLQSWVAWGSTRRIGSIWSQDSPSDFTRRWVEWRAWRSTRASWVAAGCPICAKPQSFSRDRKELRSPVMLTIQLPRTTCRVPSCARVRPTSHAPVWRDVTAQRQR